MHMTPAMPVEVFIDYGDGLSETVALGKMQPLAKELRHTHIYNTFGFYKVKATISNNISSFDVSTVVQVIIYYIIIQQKWKGKSYC